MDTSFARRPIWPLLAGGTGALLFVQTAFGAGAGLALGAADTAHVIVCAAAGAMLGAGLWFRHAPTLLFVFPASLLACIHTMPAEVLDAAYTPGRWIPWIATFVGYEVAASAWLGGAGTAPPEIAAEPGSPAVGPRTGAYTWSRVAAGALLLVAPAAWLAMSDPRRTFSASEQPELVFAHVVTLFGALIGFHAFFVGPMLDAERDRRRLRDRRDLPLSRWGVARRRLGWAAITVSLLAGLAVWTLGR